MAYAEISVYSVLKNIVFNSNVKLEDLQDSKYLREGRLLEDRPLDALLTAPPLDQSY